jgi:hypothetical protein
VLKTACVTTIRSVFIAGAGIVALTATASSLLCTKADEETLFFWSFPYVCPEPVLVKSSFLYINGSKRPFFT